MIVFRDEKLILFPTPRFLRSFVSEMIAGYLGWLISNLRAFMPGFISCRLFPDFARAGFWLFPKQNGSDGCVEHRGTLILPRTVLLDALSGSFIVAPTKGRNNSL